MINLLGFAEGGVPIALFIVLGVLLVVIALFFSLVPVRIWFKALVSGSYVSMSRLIGMKLRKVNVNKIVDAYIMSKKAGINISINEIETHDMAGGDIVKVVSALISAHAAKIPLDCDIAKAIDLAGRDVLEAVKMCVDPKVITTPMISAVAKDGIELKVKVRITVRTSIPKLIKGAGQDTIIARVGEGIVTTIGSSQEHKEVLENPDSISKTVLDKGLDAGTAFDILSVDIADIDVGANIGAKLLTLQAEADKTIAQAKAEERKSMAIALEQEMKAKTQEMRAQVIAAEAKIPEAIAFAFKSGRLGIMDYYKMQNVQADTSMRNSIAGSDKKSNN